MWPSFAPDARPLDRGKPRDEDTEGGNQPADKSLINRRLSLRSQLCAAQAFLAADGLSVERAFNRAFPLDREHKRLAVSPKDAPVPAPAAKPIHFLTEEGKRAQRIFARLMAGSDSRHRRLRNPDVRRVQQIVREQLDRRDANPADDFPLLQIARLERALDLVGAQIDAGKPSAAHAFVRILDN